MQITKDNLTIIIVTIKSEKVIEKCLNSIDPKVKKIIIENSSDENFTQKLKNKYQNIDCYNSGKNLGMGVGNNIGIKKSKTRYVMILNPDTILNNDTLDQIFKISKSLDFAILSPISDKDNFPNYKIKNKTDYLEKDFFEVDQIDGYSMLIDKSKFDEKFFDETVNNPSSSRGHIMYEIRYKNSVMSVFDLAGSEDPINLMNNTLRDINYE